MNRNLQKYILGLLFILFSITAFGQGTGKIGGRVTDKFTLETLIGLAATIPGTSLGAATNFDGNYEISNLAPGVYTVQFKYLGYATKAVSGVVVVAGKTTELNVIMEETVSTQVAEVVITSTFNRETINSLYSRQQNAISVSDGISADVIRKSPDRSSADILKRVSGASIQGGRFVVVRGMNDRYNLAYLNNSSLPTTEPDRKAFTFDIFPAGIIDNITIIKTFSPEYKADFAGGIIKVNTKQIPESNFGSFSFSGGYNQITTFKSFSSNKGGKTDWLGIDDGTRLLPSAFPNPNSFLANSNTGDQNTGLARSLNDDWSVNEKNAAPNLSFQFNKGNVFKIKKIAIGSFAALSYNRSYRFSNDTRISRDPFGLNVIDSIDVKRYGTNTLWGGIINIGAKIGNHSTLAFRNLYNVNSEDKTFIGNGLNETLDPTNNWVYLFYSNQMFTSQLEGDHTITLKNYKPKINWNLNYNDILRNIPDYRRLNAGGSTQDSSLFFGSQSFNRFFSKLNENYNSGQLNLSLPVNFSKCQNDFKVGYFIEDRKRDFKSRAFENQVSQNANRDSLFALPLEQVFLNQNFNEKNGWILSEEAASVGAYDASTKLSGYYIMMDSKIGKWLRASYGIRSEKFNFKFATRDGGDSLVLSSAIDTTSTEIFPAINITFPLTERENLRFSYGETINRPEFREIAAIGFYNYEIDIFTYGEQRLKTAFIKNYDFKYEFFPAKGEVFSISTFYKDIKNPIEFISFPSGSSSSQYTYTNASSGYVFGFEFEGRKNLSFLGDVFRIRFLDNVTLYSNLSIIESEANYQGTELGATGFSGKRVFQGQSPYLYNGGLIYDNPDNGWTAGILANVTGRRLFAAGGITFPDRYESARTVIDLQIGKRYKKLEFRATVNDLFATNLIYYLNSSQETNTLNYESETDAPLNIFRFGTQINFRVGFNF